MSIYIYADRTILSKYREKIEFFNSFLKLDNFKDKTFFKNFKPKVITNYIDQLNNSSTILLPKNINLSLKEKFLLKKPENILKYPNDFIKFVTPIFFKEANLTNLNENIACYFKRGYYKADTIYLITNRQDLLFYEDIIKGIGSKKIKFYKQSDLNKLVYDIISSNLDKNLNEYLTAFKVGTTAVLGFFKEKSSES